MEKKKGLSMPQEFTGWFIWALIVILFVLSIILIIKGKLIEGISYIKSLFRFGGN